jgi:hypothetical protein
MLEVGLFSKNSWKNYYPLLAGYYNFFSSASLDVGTDCGYSSTTGCYNSSFSIGLDVETNCGYS